MSTLSSRAAGGLTRLRAVFGIFLIIGALVAYLFSPAPGASAPAASAPTLPSAPANSSATDKSPGDGHPDTVPGKAPQPGSTRPGTPQVTKGSGHPGPTTGPGKPARQVNLPRLNSHGPAGSWTTTRTRAVALTFDDGPDPRYTPQILGLLRKNRVKATFCLVGFRARAHPDLVRRIVADGHTLCNHTWDHRFDIGKITDVAIQTDLNRTNQAILAAAPHAKIKYFRAPGGNFTPRLVGLAKLMGMTSLYWSVDPQDWNVAKYGRGTIMSNHIIWTIRTYTRPGAIILSHDLHKPDTMAAYTQLLPWLVKRFRLIALPV